MKTWKIVMIVIAAALLGWWIYNNRSHLSKDEIIAYGRSIPAGWLIALFALLPLVGFPISLFLILAGLRFGLFWGMVVSAGCIYFHHLAAYRICHGKLRERMASFVERRGHDLPKVKGSNGVWFTLMFASVHGPPYVLKLYLLALTRIPFVIYAGVGGTTYIVFGLIPVGAAAAATSKDLTWLYVAIAVLSAAMLAFNHFRSRRKSAVCSDEGR